MTSGAFTETLRRTLSPSLTQTHDNRDPARWLHFCKLAEPSLGPAEGLT